MQGVEGDIDTAHVNFLHMDYRAEAERNRIRQANPLFRVAEKHPRLTAMDTDYGMVYGGRRLLPDGTYYWRVTQWLLPSFSLIPGKGRRGGTAWIPVDDEHCVRYSIALSPEADINIEEDEARSPSGKPQQFTLKDGTIIDTMIPYGTKANQYEIDRAMQKAGHYTGIWSIAMQDKAMIEGMTRTVDRSLEHLGSSDVAVIAARRRLIKLARDLEQGIEPIAATHPELYRVRPLDLISPEQDFGPLLDQHATESKVPVATGRGPPRGPATPVGPLRGDREPVSTGHCLQVLLANLFARLIAPVGDQPVIIRERSTSHDNVDRALTKVHLGERALRVARRRVVRLGRIQHALVDLRHLRRE